MSFHLRKRGKRRKKRKGRRRKKEKEEDGGEIGGREKRSMEVGFGEGMRSE